MWYISICNVEPWTNKQPYPIVQQWHSFDYIIKCYPCPSRKFHSESKAMLKQLPHSLAPHASVLFAGHFYSAYNRCCTVKKDSPDSSFSLTLSYLCHFGGFWKSWCLCAPVSLYIATIPLHIGHTGSLLLCQLLLIVPKFWAPLLHHVQKLL